MTQIWILDDDSEFCRLVEEVLVDCGWQVCCFNEPGSLEDALESGSPDLLVLDQMLPQKPGTQVLANLRQAGHRFPVLMLSALGDPTDRVQGLEVGADDYLAKPFLPRELQLRLVNLLRAAEGGRADLRQQHAYRIGELLFHPADQLVSAADGRSERLSRGETALLLAFCQAPSLVLSREQLAQACGTLVEPGQSRTLDVRISKLRRLLERLSSSGDAAGSGAPAPIEAVRGRGYRLGITAVEPLPA